MKIIHIITGLKDGGAENVLYKICKYDNYNNHIVISLTIGGKYFLLLKKFGMLRLVSALHPYSMY